MKKTLLQKFVSKTPLLFKRLRNLSLTLSAGATALLAAPSIVDKLVIPSILENICIWTIVLGLVTAAMSQAQNEK